jgi:DNA-binding Lrp family transcriptional regulator
VAEEQERLLLTQKQRDRLKVLHEVKEGHLRQAQGAEQLGISERWVREMVRRLRTRGDGAVVHGLRGRRSKRRIEKKLQDRAVELYRREYGDFGPTLAAEYLGERHGIGVSKETLRKWLITAGAWKPEPRKVKAVHAWRPRRSCLGELVQWDTSIHDWLEGRGREPVKLIAMIDDASSELTARFVREDSTREHMKVLKSYLEAHGRPLAFYTDKAGLFRVNPRRVGYGEEKTEEGETQIGRALRELGIELIHAHSPQAKGRVERCFGTLQDRLVKGLRKAGAKTLKEANQYLEQEFLAFWRARFGREPASPVDAHRPLGERPELHSILSHVQTRRVANDYTVSWNGKHYQIPREGMRPGLRSSTVRVEGRLDGTVWVRVADRTIEATRCERSTPEPVRRAVPGPKDHNRGGRSAWMKTFDLKTSPPVWKAGSMASRTE